MSRETSIARLPSKPRVVARPSRKAGYVLPRLVWMAIGPGLMMILSVLKLESHSGQPGPIDLACLAVVIGILLIRWGTWLAGDKCDSFGGKTSVRALMGFTGLVVMLACGFWILASLVAAQQMAS